MNPLEDAHIEIKNSLKRAEVVALLKTAHRLGETKFARRLASSWLHTYPGDIEVDFLHAQALITEEYHDQAASILKRISNADPEYLDAHKLLLKVSDTPYSSADTARACLVALGERVPKDGNVLPWGFALSKARHALKSGDVRAAETHLQSALLADPLSPLPAVLHLQLARQNHDWLAVKKLAEMYHARWPDNLLCALVLAEVTLESGKEDQAVALLHQCASQDVVGQVAVRLWGKKHRFASLLPENLKIWLDIPIPASIGRELGANRLAGGPKQPAEAPPPSPKKAVTDELPKVRKRPPKPKRPARTKEIQETLINVQGELDRLADRLKKPHSSRVDGRYPVYIVLTTRAGLEAQYGQDALEPLEQAMLQVVDQTRKWSQWGALLFYADDPECVWKYGFEPAKYNDPWSIKNALTDLDETLRQRGEMIGAVLIVGGPQVVPFHHLPNPVDDDDADVPSDNPYASTDENYFIPLWPLGRIPGGGNSDPKQLLHALHGVADQRSKITKPPSGLKGFCQRILDWLRRSRLRHSFGYTAAIWRRASNSVFRPIGEPRSLAVSPPSQSGQLPKGSQKPFDLGYYNLHGLVDSPEWFGQRDPIESTAGPNYPIALSPKDVINGGRAPQVVFSEACYGAHIIDKDVDTALALKFLASGSQAVVGSTVISYGAISTPLIAADMLGQAFWKYLQDGHAVGDALRRAKIYLARQMHRRQGYLDGEDQKTLISFVLYGDPLAQPSKNAKGAKSILRARSGPQVKTVCDRLDDPGEAHPQVPAEVVQHVKKVVKAYLPGMENAKLSYTREHTECTGHDCPTHQLGAKAKPAEHPERRLVTLSKHIPQAEFNHTQYARITLDKAGKVVKLAVSR